MSSARRSNERLEDESLREAAVNLAGDELPEALGELVRRLARDGFAVVAERGGFVGGKQKRQRPPARGQLGEVDLVLGRVELGVEVVYPELVEVAQDDVLRPVGHQADPVVEGLAYCWTGAPRASSSR